MKYDPQIIEKFADKLYSKAKTIIITYTVLGLVIGGIAGTFVLPVIGSLIGALLFAVFGFSLGSEKAFHFKLEAQVALCQVQIERNIREVPPMPVFTSGD